MPEEEEEEEQCRNKQPRLGGLKKPKKHTKKFYEKVKESVEFFYNVKHE